MRRNRNLPWRIIDSCLIVSLLAAQPNVAAYAAEGSDPGIVSITSEDDFVLLTVRQNPSLPGRRSGWMQILICPITKICFFR